MYLVTFQHCGEVWNSSAKVNSWSPKLNDGRIAKWTVADNCCFLKRQHFLYSYCLHTQINKYWDVCSMICKWISIDRELTYCRYIRTRVGSCWPWRTRQDMRRHKAAAGQRSDSGPLCFLSTVSSTAEVAVLRGDDRKGGEDGTEEVQHHWPQPTCSQWVTVNNVRKE